MMEITSVRCKGLASLPSTNCCAWLAPAYFWTPGGRGANALRIRTQLEIRPSIGNFCWLNWVRGRAVGIDKTIKRLKKKTCGCCPGPLVSACCSQHYRLTVSKLCMLGSAWSQSHFDSWSIGSTWWDPPPAKGPKLQRGPGGPSQAGPDPESTRKWLY